MGISSLVKALWKHPHSHAQSLVSLGGSKSCQADKINHPRSLSLLTGKNIKRVSCIEYKLHISELDFKKKDMVVKNKLLRKQLRPFFDAHHSSSDTQFHLENILL